MNEADINQRMIELVQMETGLMNELANLQKATTQKQADLFAVQGAKQDCNFWLGKVQGVGVKVEGKPADNAPKLPAGIINQRAKPKAVPAAKAPVVPVSKTPVAAKAVAKKVNS